MIRFIRSIALMACLLAVASAQAPQIPAQPSQAIYGAAALDLFPVLSRATFDATSPVPAPACDPTKPLKAWYDTTAQGTATYNTITLNSAGAPVVQQFSMTAAQAASVNLPGSETFPPYVEPSAGGISSTFFGQPSGSPNADYLSTPAQASALLAALGGSAVLQEAPNAGVAWLWPANETRRFFDVVVNGMSFNAGLLLKYEWYKNGVGAPGTWDLSQLAMAGPVFNPTSYPDCSGVTASVPVPVRALLPNEQLTYAPFSGIQITRTDLASGAASAPTSASGFTAADRALLNQILQLLEALAAK
jgi:hypothetical protein